MRAILEEKEACCADEDGYIGSCRARLWPCVLFIHIHFLGDLLLIWRGERLMKVALESTAEQGQEIEQEEVHDAV